MKELSAHTTEEIQIHAQKEIQKQRVHLGSLKRYPGQKIFELNLRTQQIAPVDFDEKVINFETGSPNMKIFAKEDHWYCAALNEKSAFRKFNLRAKQIIDGKKSTQ